MPSLRTGSRALDALLAVDRLKREGLEPVSFTLASGEALGVSGPSGSGKSLFLRMLADLDPNGGDIRLRGRSRSEFTGPDWRRQVTYVSAVPGFWAHTVGEHFGEDSLGEVRSLLSPMALPEDLLQWEVQRLSTGEAQRVALLRALVRSPSVLLLDEPTGPLDEASSRAVEAVLNLFLAKGRGIILVTHDDQQIRRLASRCLRFGRTGAMVEEEL